MRKLPTRLNENAFDYNKVHLDWGYTDGNKDYSKLALWYCYWGKRPDDPIARRLYGVVANFTIDDIDLAEEAMDYINSLGTIDSLEHARWLFNDWYTAEDSEEEEEVDEQELLGSITKLINKVEAQYHEHADAEDEHRTQRKRLKAKLTKLQGALNAL